MPGMKKGETAIAEAPEAKHGTVAKKTNQIKQTKKTDSFKAQIMTNLHLGS